MIPLQQFCNKRKKSDKVFNMNANRNLKKKLIQTSAIAIAVAAMSASAVYAHTEYEDQVAQLVTSENATAGVSSAISGMQTTALSNAKATVTESSLVAVSSTAAEAETLSVESTSVETESTDSEWTNRLMANVDEFLYVRASADANSEIVGKLRKGDVAEIVSVSGDWTQITSGNVSGYVSNDYVVVGDDAKALAAEVCDTIATATTGGLRIRSEASTDASVVKTVSEGAELTVDTSATVDGWVKVSYNGVSGYVSSEYVTVEQELGSGITTEEEAAIEAAEAQAAAEAAAKEAAAASSQTTTTTTTQNAAVAASYDDVTLLAALIQCEAGSESYEGKLAVGAVVVNRLHSGYSSSIYGVIYQKGQFGPASSGKVASVAASGPSASCIQAATEALSGVDNTGGATSFKSASSGHAGVVIGNHVFF